MNVKDPHTIILRPYITERTVGLSYGDARIQDEKKLTRKYTFLVALDSTKIEIKSAIEAIYNAGKKKEEDFIEVAQINTITMHGKKRRVGQRAAGYRAKRRKAIITLKTGQMLEDYGV